MAADPPTPSPDDQPDRSSRPVRRRRAGRLGVGTSVAIAGVAALLTAVVVSVIVEPSEPGPSASLTDARAVPTGSIRRFDGSAFSMADYRGQPVVVNFFSSTCVPCVKEMPDFERVHRQVGDRVTFLGLDVRDTVEAGRALVKRTGVTYDIGLDPDGTLIREFGGTVLPTTVFVLPDGTIADVASGRMEPEELQAAIDDNFGG